MPTWTNVNNFTEAPEVAHDGHLVEAVGVLHVLDEAEPDSRGVYVRCLVDGQEFLAFEEELVPTVPERLEYLRGEIRAERISMGELIELQGLAEYIGPGDVELLEPAGVPEFPETRSFEVQITIAVTVDAKSAGGAVRQVKALDAAELFARGTVIEEQGYELDEDGNHI